jgi:hypothetical protein
VGQAQTTKAGMADQRDNEQELGEQLHATMATIRETVGRQLQAGEVDPRIIALAVAGELGAAC